MQQEKESSDLRNAREIVRLEREVERLHKALKKYGAHRFRCNALGMASLRTRQQPRYKKCSCGYDKAREQ